MSIVVRRCDVSGACGASRLSRRTRSPGLGSSPRDRAASRRPIPQDPRRPEVAAAAQRPHAHEEHVDDDVGDEAALQGTALLDPLAGLRALGVSPLATRVDRSWPTSFILHWTPRQSEAVGPEVTARIFGRWSRDGVTFDPSGAAVAGATLEVAAASPGGDRSLGTLALPHGSNATSTPPVATGTAPRSPRRPRLSGPGPIRPRHRPYHRSRPRPDDGGGQKEVPDGPPTQTLNRRSCLAPTCSTGSTTQFDSWPAVLPFRFPRDWAPESIIRIKRVPR